VETIYKVVMRVPEAAFNMREAGQGTIEFQQPFLSGRPRHRRPVAAGADDTMEGHDDRDRVCLRWHAHCAHGRRDARCGRPIWL